MICEIRVPSYRRPVLLRRALQSLVAQTHSDWRAVVFDDCPDSTAECIVSEVGDGRIMYHKNARRMGAIGNIDQCFHNRPMIGGHFACVVEEDNYLLPQHIERKLRLCSEHNVDVVLHDQRCEDVVEPGQPGVLNRHTTVASMHSEGLHRAVDLLPALLFSHGFSNGGAFWRLGGLSNLEVGPITHFPSVQEAARLLRIVGAVFISHDPTAVWRANDPRDSFVSRSPGTSVQERYTSRLRYLRERRDFLEIQRLGINLYGLENAIRFARQLPERRRVSAEETLLLLGRYVTLSERSSTWRLHKLIRGIGFRLLFPCNIGPVAIGGST